jgi:hypothetical protein
LSITILEIDTVSYKAAYPVHEERVVSLKNDLKIMIRPARAGDAGALQALSGTVQKVSNLILNMNSYVRDASSRATIAAMSADMRGNTDETLVTHARLAGSKSTSRAWLWPPALVPQLT